MSVTNTPLGRPARDAAPPRIGGVADPLRPTVAEVAAVPRLLACFGWNRAHGGHAPGPDGLRYDDFGRSDAARALAVLSRRVLERELTSPAFRLVRAAKSGGGERELRLADVTLRALAKSAQLAFDPVYAARMSTCCHSAARRGVWTMLAALAAAYATGRYEALLVADVRAAFPSLPVRHALDAARNALGGDEHMLWLVATLFGGDPSAVGIPQGLAVSPQHLDLVLSAALDTPLSSSPDSPVPLRYVDDLAVLSGTVPGGRRALGACRDLLAPVGLHLKDRPDEESVVDLRGGQATELLGFAVSARGGRLRFGAAPSALASLERKLRGAWGGDRPAPAAQSAAEGWLSALGPALLPCGAQPLVDDALRLARRLGFREIRPDRLLRAAERAAERWGKLLRNATPSISPSGTGSG